MDRLDPFGTSPAVSTEEMYDVARGMGAVPDPAPRVEVGPAIAQAATKGVAAVTGLIAGTPQPTPLVDPNVGNPDFVAPPEPVLPETDPRILAENKAVEFQGTLKALEAAKLQNPKLYERALKHAELYGLPMDLIMRNIDEFEQEDRFRRLRASLRTNRALDDWFTTGDNSKSITMDNLDNLNTVDWVFKAGNQALDTGKDQMRLKDIRWREMWGKATPTELVEAERIEARSDMDYGGKNWFSQGFTFALEQLPNMGEVIGAGLEGATVGGIAGAGTGFLMGGPAGAATGLGVGASATSTAYAFGESFKINAALSYSEFKKFKTSQGVLIEDSVARGAALIAALPIAALDSMSLGVSLRAFVPSKILQKEGVAAAVKEALKNETFRSIAFNVGKRFAGAAGYETLTETTQEGLQILFGEIAKESSSKGVFEPVTPGAAGERLLTTAKQTMLSMLFLGGVPASGRLAVDYTSSLRSEGDFKKLTTLTELAKNDELVKTNPEKAAEVLAATLDGSEHDTLYIPTADIKEFLQSDEDIAQVISKVPGIQQKISEAEASGSDVAIPSSDFYAYIAPTDAAAKIIDRLKFSPEGMTKNEASAFLKAFEKVATSKSIADVPDESSSVYADMYQKLRNAGFTPDQSKQQATLYDAFFNSMGTQTGRNSMDIYNSYNVQVERHDTPGQLDPSEGGFGQEASPFFVPSEMDDIETMDRRQWTEMYDRGKLNADAHPAFSPTRRQLRKPRSLPTRGQGRVVAGVPSMTMLTKIDHMANRGLDPADIVRELVHEHAMQNDLVYATNYNAPGGTKRGTKKVNDVTEKAAIDAVYEAVQRERGTFGPPLRTDRALRIKGAKPGSVIEPAKKDNPRYVEQADFAHFSALQRNGMVEPQAWNKDWKRLTHVKREPRGTPRNLVWHLDRAVNAGLTPADIARTLVHVHAMQRVPAYAKAVTAKAHARMDPNGVPLPDATVRKPVVAQTWERLREEVAKFGDPKETFNQSNVVEFPGRKKDTRSFEQKKSDPELSRLRDEMFQQDENHLDAREKFEIARDVAEHAGPDNFVATRKLQIAKEALDKAELELDKAYEAYHNKFDELFSPTFEQGSSGTVRGSITFGQDKTLIRLFKNANLSTLLHESGHLFLQVMTDLSFGKQGYSGTLLQNDNLRIGDFITLMNDDGDPIHDGARRITDMRSHRTLGDMVKVEDDSKWYKQERAFLVSQMDDTEDTTTDATPNEAEAVDREPVSDADRASFDDMIARYRDDPRILLDWLANSNSMSTAHLDELLSGIDAQGFPPEQFAALTRLKEYTSNPGGYFKKEEPVPTRPTPEAEVVDPKLSDEEERAYTEAQTAAGHDVAQLGEEGAPSALDPQAKAAFLKVGDMVEIVSGPEKLIMTEKPVPITNIFHDPKFASEDNPTGTFITVEGSNTGMPLRDIMFHHRPESLAPAVQQQIDDIVKGRAGKKADPIGIDLNIQAMLNADDAVQHVVDISRATARLEQNLSDRQAGKVLKALRLQLNVVKESQNERAWAELEKEMSKLTDGKVNFSVEVRKAVDSYIENYKKKKAKAEEKKTKDLDAADAGKAKASEGVRKEQLKQALTELSTVVERATKLEYNKEATEQFKADMKTLQEWLGEDGPLYSVEAQEKFAKSFEAYLFDGTAPTAALARAFDRFKQWLKLVYRKVSTIGVRGTPEVEAVFGRMLTSDQTIGSELQSAAFMPAFNSASEAGMTEEQWAEYMGRVNALGEAGRAAADKAIITEAQKLRTAAMQKEKATRRAKYTAQLENLQVYRTQAFLKGKNIPGIENVKLDRAAVQAILGPKQLGTIPDGSSMWVKEGGVHPDVVAALFGYPSGAEMLKDFQNNQPIKTLVEERVQKEVAELTDAQLVEEPEIKEMAAAKLRSDVYKDFIISELRQFAKLMGFDFTDAHVIQFQRMAEKLIDDKPMRTVLKRNFVKEYTEADRRLGKLIDRALRKKDWTTLVDLRRKQLFNHFMVNKAYQTKDDARKAKEYLTSFPKKKANVIDQEYLSQIRNLLIKFEFAKGQVDETVKPFSKFIDDEIDAGQMIVIAPSVQTQKLKAWQKMTWGEVSTIADAVKNLEFVGRNRRKLFREGRALDLKAAIEHITQGMDKNLRPRKSRANLNKHGWEQFKGWFNGYVNSHIKVEQLCDWLDGGAASGPAHQNIFLPFAEAQTREVELTQKYADQVLNLITQKDVGYWSENVVVKGMNLSMKRSEIMAIALNLGNESNRSKLMKGMGWTEKQIEEATAHLDKKDWEIVQGIWDTIDKLWPNILELTARLGLPRPDKVEAIPVTNKHGTFRGGYYPVVYDPSKSADVLARGLTTKAEQQFGFEPSSLFPPKSFTNDRNDEYARPMLLDMSVLPGHLSKIIHYITHAEPVYNTTKILNNNEFKSRMMDHFGETMYAHMLGWIQNIAKGEHEVAGLAGWQRFSKVLRSNITVAALGFRATTVVAQAGGILAGAEMIGLGGVTMGLREMYGSGSLSQIKENMDFIKSKSGEMRHRTQFLERDLSYINNAFSTQGQVKRMIRDAAMAPILAADSVFSMGIWMGAYQSQLKKSPHDDATAVAYADKVVRLTQGSGASKDLAAIQRGNEFYRLFTMFYTYFNAYQNRVTDIARNISYKYSGEGEVNKTGFTPNEALRYLYLVVLPAVLFDFLFKGALKGDFGDDDEKTGKWTDAVWKTFAYTFAGAVGIRDLANYAARDQQWFKYSGVPVLRTIEMVLERLDRVTRAATDSNKDLKGSDVFRTVTDVAGLTAGLPVDAPTLFIYNMLKANEQGGDFGLADFFVRR